MTKLLIVCMANICRSPMAQIVTLHLAERASIAGSFLIESAGTHAGLRKELPDPRVKTVLAGRGYSIGKRRTRQVTPQDFSRYDLVLAMDQANLSFLRRICPDDQTHKLRMFMEFAQRVEACEVPDPYYGNVEGFERVLDLCEAGGRGLVEHCRSLVDSP